MTQPATTSRSCDCPCHEGADVFHVVTCCGSILGARRGALSLLLFLALELMSIAVYCLAGLDRRSPRAAEGALKVIVSGQVNPGRSDTLI